MNNQLNLRHHQHEIKRDSSKVICRLYVHGGDPARIKAVIQRILQMDAQTTKKMLEDVLSDFSGRHKDLPRILRDHFQEIVAYISSEDYAFTPVQKMLIGAYFTMEYAIESAALFNPSIVPHPDQSNIPEGSLRFIMSLRAVGEGHISSLVFRSGIIDEQGEMDFDPVGTYANRPKLENLAYEKSVFSKKLEELEVRDDVIDHILGNLTEKFSYEELKKEISNLSETPKFTSQRQLRGFNHMHRLANSNYRLKFESNSNISERVIFPISEVEKGGIEDARFVPFENEDGERIYYATYTAYDGSSVMPQLIETHDFRHFTIRTLNGDAVQNKDLALFPRKVDGQYVMLGRQDGINNHIMFSEDILCWEESEIIQKPSEPWEFVQLGNCGSPIETERGWLMLYHGVGPIRAYSIGAALLDLEDPSKIIARLKQPLLMPDKDQQIGYVPNVVYTCGIIKHQGWLVIPYAMSDIQPAFASVKLDELLDAMQKEAVTE
jgi:predicted GH43/DUF377 family glycosyl hydrolase